MRVSHSEYTRSRASRSPGSRTKPGSHREGPELHLYVERPRRTRRTTQHTHRAGSHDNSATSYTPFSTHQTGSQTSSRPTSSPVRARFDASARSRFTSSVSVADPARRRPRPSLAAWPRRGLARRRPRDESHNLFDWFRSGVETSPSASSARRASAGPDSPSRSLQLAQGGFDHVRRSSRLAEVRAPANMLPTITATSGAPNASDPPSTGKKRIESRAGACRPRRCSTTRADFSAAIDVLALLTTLPGATFLVTSRGRVRVPGRRVLDVRPLALPHRGAPPPRSRSSSETGSTMFQDRARPLMPAST